MTTWGSHNRKGKTLLDSNKVSDDGVMGWNWHWLDHIQTICTLLQADNDINTSSLNFLLPDALSDAQAAMSKH